MRIAIIGAARSAGAHAAHSYVDAVDSAIRHKWPWQNGWTLVGPPA